MNKAYLRVSTNDQNTEKFKTAILHFCNERDFGKVDFVEEIVSGRKNWKTRKIAEILNELKKGDRIIVPELSRLGRSTLEVLDILQTAREKKIPVFSVKENFELSGNNVQAKIMTTMLSLFAELERDFISQRTKEGLAAVKAKGVKLGRPRGSGTSKLDKHKNEILHLLNNGSSKTFVAKKFKSSNSNFYDWLKKNKINLKVGKLWNIFATFEKEKISISGKVYRKLISVFYNLFGSEILRTKLWR